MKKTLSLLFLLIFGINCLPAQNSLLTTAEKSGFESTANYVDVQTFIIELTKISKNIKVESIAKTIEGRDVPLLIIADPMPQSPADLINDKRIVVYIQANIHAGEVEGKEASLMLARDLVNGLNNEILKNVVVLICPNFNPDGNEAISTKNRTHQNGPKNGVGLRYNGQMLDLNRDAIKLESPEMTGLIHNVLLKWDPSVLVDCHTTNGSYHEEPVTFTWMMNPAGNRALINYMRDKMMPDVSLALTEKYNVLNCFYGEFTDLKNPENGWISYAAEPRYLTNYIGVRNRLAILNENYVYADYKTRVLGSYSLLHSILDYSASHSVELKTMLKKVDLQTIARGTNPAVADSFPIVYEVKPTPEKIKIRAYEVDVVVDTDGREQLHKSDRKKLVNAPYLADYFASKSVSLPYAYLIKLSDPAIANLLAKHGIKVEKLIHHTTLEVETFKITDLKPEGRLNQGHYTNSVKGILKKDTIEFLPGNYVVRMAQPLANLAAYMLEPETDDALLLWNFFDRYLVPQWGKGFYDYPVYRLMKKTELQTQLYLEE
ncbi:MAG: M14 family metallopeptidase [Bacteroidales bacterium]|nr:M14 family metallopeptidase [Bacteroidales bacterium]